MVMPVLLCICIVAFKNSKFNLKIKNTTKPTEYFREQAKVKFFIIRKSVEITLGLFPI